MNLKDSGKNPRGDNDSDVWSLLDGVNWKGVRVLVLEYITPVGSLLRSSTDGWFTAPGRSPAFCMCSWVSNY